MLNFVFARVPPPGENRRLLTCFPAEATAATIRAVHEAGARAKKGVWRFQAMVTAFSAAFAQKMAGQYATGIIYDWHIFTWLYVFNDYTNRALAIERVST